MSGRRPLIAGNWKMNTGRAEATRLATAIAAAPVPDADLVVCPPFPWLIPIADVLAGSAVGLGAQDCWTEPKGAFTGAVSAEMLAEICTYVIVGHSERRRLFHEDDALVRAKLDAVLATSLHPILCVGEDLAVRESGSAVAHVENQLTAALSDRDAATIARCSIAYEPVWAIGTGVAARPADAEEMAAAMRSLIAEIAGREIAASIRLLYGGSVTGANAGEILSQPNVDGALVGGASLDARSFLEIAAAAD